MVKMIRSFFPFENYRERVLQAVFEFECKPNRIGFPQPAVPCVIPGLLKAAR